jgi:hypothetical protein
MLAKPYLPFGAQKKQEREAVIEAQRQEDLSRPPPPGLLPALELYECTPYPIWADSKVAGPVNLCYNRNPVHCWHRRPINEVLF